MNSRTSLVLVLLVTTLVYGNTLISEDFESGTTDWNIVFNDDFAEGHANQSIISGSPDNGSQVLSINVLTPQDSSWYIQLPFPTWTAKRNTIYRLSMHAKSENPIQVGVSYIYNSGKPNESSDYKEGFTFNLYNQWGFYTGEFSSDVEGENALSVVIDLGEYSGNYQFDNLKLEEIGQIDESETWYNEADARIEEIRKGDIPFNFLDTSGTPITGGEIHISQVKHHFPFGTSITIGELLPPLSDESDPIVPLNKDDSLWNVTTAAELFNSITIENHFKWVDFERIEGTPNYETITPYIEMAEQNDMLLRGHTLVWGLQQYGFQYHWVNFLYGKDLADAIKARITRDVSYFKGNFSEYDVWNEPFHETEFFKRTDSIFPEDNNYWTLMDSAFHWAHAQDSSVDLYLNEYSVIKGGSTGILYDLAKGMLERNVPITGLGVQCHFENNSVEPEIIRQRLDQLDSLGLKIKVTEFDLGTPYEGVELNERSQAEQYAKFLRTTFSHPAVDGVTLWGFWDKTIWNKPNPELGNIGSGLYNIDKTRKPAGDSLYHLIKEVWNTDTTFVLNENSSLRGFYGAYNINIVDGNKEYEGTFYLSPDSTIDSIILTPLHEVNANKIEKKAQRFSAITDTKSREVLVVGIDKSTPVALSILDLRGRVLYQSTAEAISETRFKLPDLPAGIYLQSIVNGGKQLQHKLLLTR